MTVTRQASGIYPQAGGTRPATYVQLLGDGKAFLEWVVFQKWRWPCLYRPFKGIAVDEQANDDIVHLGRFREANGLADQAFNARP